MNPFFETSDVAIFNADSRDAWKRLPESSVDAIVTSPPYWGLRDYGVDGQIGLEDDPAAYIAELADLLTGYGERVMKPGGSLWLNLGDTYSSANGWQRDPNGTSSLEGSSQSERFAGATSTVGATRNARAAGLGDFPAKCLLMIPERVALALIERGWILRNRVVWAKPNGMPSSVTDRLANKHEAMFHFVRERTYHYDLDAIREPYAPGSVGRYKYAFGNGPSSVVASSPAVGNGDAFTTAPNAKGANPGDVWAIPTQPYPEAHFAVFPPELVRRPILATVPEGGTVLDPFFGSGTVGVMARSLGRRTVGVELSPDYCALAAKRFRQDVFDLAPGV